MADYLKTADVWTVLDLIVAEFKSDPMSTQCFDSGIVARAIELNNEQRNEVAAGRVPAGKPKASMNLRLQSSRLDTERNIAPPMKLAITLPVIVDEANAGVIIYVGVSPFSQRPANPILLENIARELATRINAGQAQ